MSSDSKKAAMSSLEQLKASGTLVVADTGDFEVSEEVFLPTAIIADIFFEGGFF